MKKVMVIQKLMDIAILAVCLLLFAMTKDATALVTLGFIWIPMIFSKEPCIQL